MQNTKNMANKFQATEVCLVSLAVQVNKGYNPIKLNDQNVDDDVTVTHLNTCESKTLQEKFANLLQENYMDKEYSLLWLSAGCIYPETERFPVAIQDQVIKTINYENHCLEKCPTDADNTKEWANNCIPNSWVLITICISVSR
jgi:hypothetical protein